MSCGIPNCTLCAPSPNSWAGWQNIRWVDETHLFTKVWLDDAAAWKRKQEEEYAKHIASLEKMPGAIRMFRTWVLTPAGDLRAMVADHTWKPGENVTLASGSNGSKDSGFYGFTSLAELQSQEEDWWYASQSGEADEGDYFVCGTILCYGHCKLSEKGGRVQKAIPEYIIEPDGSDPDFGMLVVNAAEKYGMKIMTIEQAEELKTGFIPYAKDDN